MRFLKLSFTWLTQLVEVLVCKQSAVSVDAHYREIRFPRNPFFKENCKKWIVRSNSGLYKHFYYVINAIITSC